MSEKSNGDGVPPDAWADVRISTTGQLALFLGGSGDSFTGMLLELIAKADREKRERLELAFPREVMAWEVWMGMTAPTFRTLRATLEALGWDAPPKSAPDWREIFKRYINVVAEHEGVTFLYERDWTPEEWAAIDIAEREAHVEWQARK